MSETLVTAIIPAFNASRTLDATLRSARAQTHRALEILVVDDGSVDDTAGIALRHAREDGRVRLLQRRNGGVALARNHGLEAASGKFVAPLDADDLWHPEKIARQLSTLEAASKDCALAYNWFRRIDLNDRIVGASASPRISGPVLFRHIDWNFISNGSNILVRTEVAREVGYDPALVDGCEDYLFQLRIASRFHFACVPAFLTGYRVVPGGLSSQTGRMIRGHMQMYTLLRDELDDPRAHRLIDRRLATLHVEWARHNFRRRALGASLTSIQKAWSLDSGGARLGFAAEVQRVRERLSGAPASGAGILFANADPEIPDGTWTTRRSPSWLARLEEMDRDG